MSDPAPKAGVSPAVLVLSLLLAVAVTAAGMLFLRPAAVSAPAPAASGENASPAAGVARLPDEPFTQKDTVSPKDRAYGEVVYPLPYSTKPSLKLTSAGRAYDTVKADEFGFTWAVRPKAEDFKPDTGKDKNVSLESLLGGNLYSVSQSFLKPGLVFDDFTWEAKGVRGSRLPVPFEQKGSFNALPNTEGEVGFAVPYAQPPHVDLTGNSYTTVTELRATGFKWKNVCEKGKEFFAAGSVHWTAKGVRPGEGKN